MISLRNYLTEEVVRYEGRNQTVLFRETEQKFHGETRGPMGRWLKNSYPAGKVDSMAR